MATGKTVLSVAPVYSGAAEFTLESHALALAVLAKELSITAGTASIETSVAIARGQAVNIFNGLLRLASAASNIPAVGICIAGAGAGDKARIILFSGYASGFTGLTINSYVYLGNAGALVFVKPGAGFIQGLGYTLSATEMFVAVSAP